MSTKTTKPASLFTKSLVTRSKMDDAYLEAYDEVKALARYATEAEELLRKACESGEPLKYQFPRSSIGEDFYLIGAAAKAERALTRLITLVRQTGLN